MIMVEQHTFALAREGECLITYGLFSCSAIVLFVPGKAAVMGHIDDFTDIPKSLDAMLYPFSPKDRKNLKIWVIQGGNKASAKGIFDNIIDVLRDKNLEQYIQNERIVGERANRRKHSFHQPKGTPGIGYSHKFPTDGGGDIWENPLRSEVVFNTNVGYPEVMETEKDELYTKKRTPGGRDELIPGLFLEALRRCAEYKQDKKLFSLIPLMPVTNLGLGDPFTNPPPIKPGEVDKYYSYVKYFYSKLPSINVGRGII